MADFARVREHLEARGFTVSCFATAAEACDYLDRTLDGKSIGIGGSVTIRDMGLAERLGTHNRIVWHWAGGTAQEASETQISPLLCQRSGRDRRDHQYRRHRQPGGLRPLRPQKGLFHRGAEQAGPDYDAALWRARNIAGPKNAQRLQKKTPCAVKGDQVL